MQSVQMQLAKELAKECWTIEDIHNKLKDLFKDSLQQIIEAEMVDHLGYDKHNPDGDNTGNSRNGYSKKNIKSKYGPTEIQIPRDRNTEFEPQIIGKHEKTANAIEEQIIGMYAKGMSARHRGSDAGYLRYRCIPQPGEQSDR